MERDLIVLVFYGGKTEPRQVIGGPTDVGHEESCLYIITWE
jgi:hypothetical protein